ncbi:hypothetical protein K8R47_03240 [archaeon]|nr:hypothetical protein [archaeon]
MVNHKKGIGKSSIALGTAMGANLLGGLLESAMPDQFKGAADFAQSVATFLTPYFYAEKCMINGHDDTKWYGLAVQTASAAIGLPAAVYRSSGIAEALEANEVARGIQNFVGNHGVKFGLTGAAIPWIKPLTDYSKS